MREHGPPENPARFAQDFRNNGLEEENPSSPLHVAGEDEHCELHQPDHKAEYGA